MIRKSIPVNIHLSALADLIRIEGTLERHAVETMVGPLPENISESAALSVLLELAKEVVDELVLEAQYATLAASRDKEDEEFDMAVRARRSHRSVLN